MYIRTSVDIYNDVVMTQVDAYEAKKQELMAENTDLRSLLRSMQVSYICKVVERF